MKTLIKFTIARTSRRTSPEFGWTQLAAVAMAGAARVRGAVEGRWTVLPSGMGEALVLAAPQSWWRLMRIALLSTWRGILAALEAALVDSCPEL